MFKIICEQCGRSVDKMGKNKIINGLCNKHYSQFRKYKKCLDDNPRTLKDLNEIILYDDYAEIVLYDKNNVEKGKCKIDIEDIEKVKEYKWTIGSHGYVVNGNKGILIHRIILNCDVKEIEVDHINHDKLDNRKENLRLVTSSQNKMNRKISTGGNITWSKERKRWRAYICIDGKKICLGSFIDLDDAIKIRLKAEEEYYGEYRFKRS